MKKNIINIIVTFIALVIIRMISNHYYPNEAFMEKEYRTYIDAFVGSIVITIITNRYKSSKQNKSLQEGQENETDLK